MLRSRPVFLLTAMTITLCGCGATAPSEGTSGPTIITLFPESTPAGSPDIVLIITGANFSDALHNRSQAVWSTGAGIVPLATGFVSANELTATVPAALLRTAVRARVSVQSSDLADNQPPRYTSDGRDFRVVVAPVVITALAPTRATAGSAPLILSITGTHFEESDHSQSRAVWMANGRPTLLRTTFVSSQQLTAVVPASLLGAPITAQLLVETGDAIETTPSSRSNTLLFTVIPPDPPPDGQVAAIVISDPPTSIGIGEQAILQAWANGAKVGRIPLQSPIRFSSLDENIATVSPIENDGYLNVDFWATLRGVALGTAVVTATGGGKTAGSVITVGAPAVTIRLTPIMATINAAQCQAVQLTATLEDATGAALTGRHPVWSSNSPSAFVDQSGLVFAFDSGSATITASTGLISATAVITVVGRWPGRFACDD